MVQFFFHTGMSFIKSSLIGKIFTRLFAPGLGNCLNVDCFLNLLFNNILHL